MPKYNMAGKAAKFLEIQVTEFVWNEGSTTVVEDINEKIKVAVEESIVKQVTEVVKTLKVEATKETDLGVSSVTFSS